ncbi:class I SAM-dependent methyltransferase [Clostridiaceae bacterium M8S5]|nr:class I SAM-dependent methyltransferase [Clostridiaceae bacterium M8S5]
MKVFRQTSLYQFLLFCERNNISKNVLDCGAGGDLPPLALFAQHGYKTAGIEIDQNEVIEAKKYGDNNNISLNIEQGDMRELPFENESFGAVYSWNSIFHMKKIDIEKAINEMKRVLKSGGLMYVNLLSIDDDECGEGTCIGNNEYKQEERDKVVIHTYYEDDEGDKYFDGMELVYKQKRVIYRDWKGQRYKIAYIDYVMKK